MAQTFPDAPVFALLYSAVTGPASLEGRIVASPLQRLPGASRRHRWLLPFYPYAIESFDFAGYDVILSSHHTAAKGILRNANQMHVSYCHTPMRALWERPFEELRSLPGPLRPLAASTMSKLRVWDYATASRVDTFIANSRTTQLRIAKHYGRESVILNPPIDVDRFTPGAGAQGEYYLIASRLVPYKRVDLAVAATAALGRKLVVVGGGPGEHVVTGAAHVDYRGHVTDSELLELMRGARAMIFPAFEDFGMAMIEMMACGRPVIAYGAGGAAETGIDGVTGVFAVEQTVDAFVAAIKCFERTVFDPERIRSHAETFSQQHFQAALRKYVAAAFETLQDVKIK
jgi:glycosyltransferase involved in cell wall biosynthesis